MTLNEFKASVADLVRQARASGIPPLDISLAMDDLAAATGAPIPPNSDPIETTDPEAPIDQSAA